MQPASDQWEPRNIGRQVRVHVGGGDGRVESRGVESATVYTYTVTGSLTVSTSGCFSSLDDVARPVFIEGEDGTASVWYKGMVSVFPTTLGGSETKPRSVKTLL